MDERNSTLSQDATDRPDDGLLSLAAGVVDGPASEDLPSPDNEPRPARRALFGAAQDADEMPSPASDLPPELLGSLDVSELPAKASEVPEARKLALASLPQDKILPALQEKVSQTHGVSVAGNYLVNFEGDFLRGLRQLTWLSDDERSLASGLMNHHVIRSVVTNPALDLEPEIVAQLRHQAGLDVSRGFGADWDAYVSTLEPHRREAASTVLELVSNLARLHDMRCKRDMSAFEAREAIVTNGPAGVASAIGAAIGSLSVAGSSFMNGIRRGASERAVANEVGAAKRLNSWATEPVMGQPAEPVDIDPVVWRDQRAQSCAEEIERLSTEMVEHAGESEWENGRGLEVASDLKLAIESVDEILESGQLSEDKKLMLREKVEKSGLRIEAAERRMVSEKMRELVQQTAEAISGLIKRMVASVVKLTGSIAGAGDTEQATPPQSVEKMASPLAQGEFEVHDSSQVDRMKPR